jgi:DNA (cytosine-5)-methyltransferase 1
MSKCNSIDFPAPTLTTVPHEYVVFIDKYYGISTATGVESPASTLTTVDRMSIISCSIYQNSINERIIHYIDNNPYIAILANDSENTKRLKIAMCLLGISDLSHRMLKVEEMKLIHSFPKDYILLGSDKEQKKFIGNSVPCNTVAAILGFLNK